jgi:hypothetical protein
MAGSERTFEGCVRLQECGLEAASERPCTFQSHDMWHVGDIHEYKLRGTFTSSIGNLHSIEGDLYSIEGDLLVGRSEEATVAYRAQRATRGISDVGIAFLSASAV